MKLDENLYDYYGKCWRTHEDQECIDIFNYDVLHIEKVMTDSVTGKPIFPDLVYTLDELLSEADKALLEGYAPKLFNTLNESNDLCSAMLEWATLLQNYRHSKNNFGVAIQKSIINNYPNLRNKKSKQEKLNTFQNNLKSVFDAIGGGAVGTPKGNTLKKLLDDAYHNPNDYFTSKPKKDKPSIANMKDYLNSLDLNGKSKIISDFLKEIK